MSLYPFGLPFQGQQPLVFLGGEVFAKTRQPPGAATLVSALGVEHPLRSLGPAREMSGRHLRLNREEVHRLFLSEIAARQRLHGDTETLRYFVEYLAPAVSARDWAENPGAGPPAPQGPQPEDWSAGIGDVLDRTPVPEVPSPSLWMLGRAWLLGPQPPRPGHLCVRRGDAVFGVTGEYHLVRTLEQQWRAAAHKHLAESARGLAAAGPSEGEALRAARAELARSGCVERADLLYVPGPPPLLGHRLPAHYNRVLGRQCERDLAVALRLALPPQVSGLQLLLRGPGGRWEPYTPPHGLCLGDGPPDGRPETPGLAVAAYLRWAALRLAANGQFHAGDGSGDAANGYDTTTDYSGYY
jgi:hypothetical protein